MACFTQNISVASPPEPVDWQSLLADSIRSPAELCRLLELDPALAAEASTAAEDFPLLAPRPFLDRIRPGDSTDPLLLQVIPQASEAASPPGFGPDPLCERAAMCGHGLLHKYQGRLLMVTTGRCAVHCRFCFRRHFSHPRQPKLSTSSSHWLPAMQRIAADRSIHEVVLSGGDPLVLPDTELSILSEQLAKIPHLRRLRVHTRLPVVIPQRVTDDLISWLRGGRLSTAMVIHTNHPAELDRAVEEAIGQLVDSGIPVLSQSVLLRGVNDRIEVLGDLFERLVNQRVIPYYLHQLDPVAGAAHFETPVSVGLALMAELRARLPGYAVPRYVRETPGGASKELLA